MRGCAPAIPTLYPRPMPGRGTIGKAALAGALLLAGCSKTVTTTSAAAARTTTASPTPSGPDRCEPVVAAEDLRKDGADKFSADAGRVADQAIAAAEAAASEEDRQLLDELADKVSRARTDFDSGMSATNYTKLSAKIQAMYAQADTLKSAWDC
jgi:hypothetical protein